MMATRSINRGETLSFVFGADHTEKEKIELTEKGEEKNEKNKQEVQEQEEEEEDECIICCAPLDTRIFRIVRLEGRLQDRKGA